MDVHSLPEAAYRLVDLLGDGDVCFRTGAHAGNLQQLTGRPAWDASERICAPKLPDWMALGQAGYDVTSVHAIVAAARL